MENYLLKNSLQKIGQALLTLRHKRNDKQQTVARATGISVSVLSKIECGKYQQVTLGLLHKLADYYGITFNDLVGINTNGNLSY